MSDAELKKQHEQRLQDVASDAALFRNIFITPVLDSEGSGRSFMPAGSERQKTALSNAIKGTFLEECGDQGLGTAIVAANSVTAYHGVYDALPSDEVQASAIMTMKNMISANPDTRAAGMINDSLGENMSSQDGIARRNHQVAMITPVVLMQATSEFVTPVPTGKDYAEIFVVDRHAGSTFGDLTAGDIIDETFNGQYATMDQFYLLGVGDGTKTEFEFKIADVSKNAADMPIRKRYISIYHAMDKVASDQSGESMISGQFDVGGTTVVVTSTGTGIDYAKGIFKVAFSQAPAAGVVLNVGVDIDIEKAPQLIPTIEHRMKSFTVRPHEAALTANESIQAVFGARREYSLELRNMQMTAARNVLAAEKDRHRLNKMWKFASDHFDWPRLPKAALSKTQHYADLKEFFGIMDIRMVHKTHKSGIKGMFLGLDATNLIKASPDFRLRPNYRCINQPHYVGRYGEYAIYCDPSAETWSGLAIGKGENYGDSAFVAADAISAIHYPHNIGAPAHGPGKGMTHSDTFYELAFRDIHPYRGRNYLFTFTFVAQQGD